MNEEIEYAEMLEIPVSTVNVIRKNTPTAPQTNEMKEEIISRVNERYATALDAEIPLADSLEESLQSEEKGYEVSPRFLQDNEAKDKVTRLHEGILKAEFGLSCALCLGIFLTNVWMPNSAINTFFKSLAPENKVTDERVYTDFTLSKLLGADSKAELTLSPAGVLSFVDEGCVYPTADGKVTALTCGEDGRYTVEISHSDTFLGVIAGLDYVYYEVGNTVKHNVPIGYSNGKNEVNVTMYSEGNLLNCFAVSEDNTLSWLTTEE